MFEFFSEAMQCLLGFYQQPEETIDEPEIPLDASLHYRRDETSSESGEVPDSDDDTSTDDSSSDDSSTDADDTEDYTSTEENRPLDEDVEGSIDEDGSNDDPPDSDEWIPPPGFVGFDTLEEAMVYAKFIQQCHQKRGIELPIEVTTDYYEIPDLPEIFIQRELDGRIKKEPFRGLPSSVQLAFRRYVERCCRDNGWIDQERKVKCQLGYYAQRWKQLNEYYYFKSPNYRSDIVALDYGRTDCIPVVIYRPNPPKLDRNQIAIWHSAGGTVRVTIRRDDH